MSTALAKLLCSKRSERVGDSYTHVSCNVPRGRFLIERDVAEHFWKLYCDQVATNPDIVCGLAEIPQEHCMLVVDGDIKKPISEVLKTHPEMKVSILNGDDKVASKYIAPRLYSEKHITEVIRAYQEVIQSVTREWNPEHSVCLVLEKTPYISGNDVKSGFHLAFVNYFSNRPLQDQYLIPRVVQKVKERQIFADIGIEDSSKVLDVGKAHSKSKPWLLYGSRKNENTGVYKVTRAYAHDCVELDPTDVLMTCEIYDSYENRIEFKTENDAIYALPRILSVNTNFRKTVDIVPVFDATANITFAKEKVDRDDMKYDQTYEQLIATASDLIKLLSVARSHSRDEWIEIGWILFSISNGSDDGLNLWIEFSKKAEDKFSLAVCAREWSTMTKGNFTIGSLKHYAKIDSPEEYKIFTTKRASKAIEKAISGSHHDLAKALYESYSTEYVCASLKPEVWYYFDPSAHFWQLMEEGIELRKKISDDLVPRYIEMCRGQLSNLLHADDDNIEEKNNAQSRLKSIQKLILNLKSNTFKNAIMKECREVFYDRNFSKNLGKNKYILALKNGVYDLENHIFRAGKPEDYCVYQMPISYYDFNELDEWIMETRTFFEKLFPDVSIREYVLDRLAEMLVGGNKRKHVYFWTGRGNNGKSVLKMLLQKMFGDYFIDIPNSVLVGQKPKSGQACPELARAANGVRAAFTQEPNKNDVVNTGALKEYSGNDTFYARSLFQNGGDISPMFKLVMICNELPKLNASNDPATWARCRVIPFEAIFSDNPPEDEDEQFRLKIFKKDENFDEKIPNMLSPLFWILTKRLPKIKRIIYEPEKVRQATDRYRRSQDVYAQFIDERIIMDESKSISVMEFFQSFRDWHRQAFPGSQIPTRNDCQDYLLDTWGSPTNYRWAGYRMREDRDDIESGNAEVVQSVDYENMDANPLLNC